MNNVAHNVLIIVQARMGSNRLPGKTLAMVAGTPLLEHQLKRMRRARHVGKIVVATTVGKEDDAIETLCAKLGISCFRGSSDDVLERYYRAALAHPDHDVIARVTGDCPLIDPAVMDAVIELFYDEGREYASNIEFGKESFPDGMSIEVFTRGLLERTHGEAKLSSEREHVTLSMRNRPDLARGHLALPENLSHYRMTVDNPEDLEVIAFLIETVGPDAPYQAYVEALEHHPEVRTKNAHLKRYEGLERSLKKEKKKF